MTHSRRAVHEHTSVLGLAVVMDHGWIVTLADQQGRQLSLLTKVATGNLINVGTRTR